MGNKLFDATQYPLKSVPIGADQVPIGDSGVPLVNGVMPLKIATLANVLASLRSGVPMTPPNDATFSWLNQPAGVIVDSADFLPVVMSYPAGSTDAIAVRGQAITGGGGSTGFTLTAFMSVNLYPANSVIAGIGVINKSGDGNDGKMVYIAAGFSSNVYQFVINRYTNYTTFSSTLVAVGGQLNLGGVWFRVKSDGTTLTFSYSVDGTTFIPLITDTIASFIGNPTKAFWMLDALNSHLAGASLWSWANTSP